MGQIHSTCVFWELNCWFGFCGVMPYEEYMFPQYNKYAAQRILLAVLTWNATLKKHNVSVTWSYLMVTSQIKFKYLRKSDCKNGCEGMNTYQIVLMNRNYLLKQCELGMTFYFLCNEGKMVHFCSLTDAAFEL